MEKKLIGGTFNLRAGRNGAVVKKEVEKLLSKHNLDFLAVQEAAGYRRLLNNIEGYNYIIDPRSVSTFQLGILVKDTLQQDRIQFPIFGNGWWTSEGRRAKPRSQPQVRIAKWLYVRTVHLPTPTFWRDGHIDMSRTPHERADDLIAQIKGLLVYFVWPCRWYGRIAVGDWNEPPYTKGKYTPNWLAKRRKAKTWVPRQPQGHKDIDWVMGKGVTVTQIFKDLEIREGSDHEPVIFTVIKSNPV